MLHCHLVIVLLFAVCFAGCGQSSATSSEEHKIVTADQLVPALRQIEKTGEYESVLPGLSAGLEQAGFVNEAARIQEFFELPTDQTQKLAGVVATEVERTQNSQR